MCEANPTLIGSSGPVDVSAACPVLRAWDVHDNLDSHGALLFRRFASRALASVGGAVANPTVFANAFDANDPEGMMRAWMPFYGAGGGAEAFQKLQKSMWDNAAAMLKPDGK